MHDDLKFRVCEAIDRHRDRIIGLGNAIRDTPELGFREKRSAATVAKCFADFGMPYAEGLALTGVKTVLAGNADGPTIGLLGELDCLPCHDSPFTDSEWEVTPQLDRVGIRLRPLHGVPPDIPADLPSIGVQFGSVQWHPDGTLVLMGPDHPVTGGYLQPVTVISSERWKLAQLAPGERVSLRTE